MSLYDDLKVEQYERDRRSRRRYLYSRSAYDSRVTERRNRQKGGSMETPTGESPLAAMFKKNGVKFGGTYAADQIPPNIDTYTIINTDPASQSGKHWVLLWKDPRRTSGGLKCFDSYGGPFTKYFRSELVDGSVSNVNSTPYQSDDSNTCGEWSTLYGIMNYHGKNLINLIQAQPKTDANDRSNDVKLMQLWNQMKGGE